MHYELGDCSVFPALREIWKGPERVGLEPKAYDFILYLLRNRDRVIEKDEIISAVWDGRFISESTLSGVVKLARRALGDNGKTQSHIRTVHGRGFRYVGQVREIQAADVGPDEKAGVDGNAGFEPAMRPSIAIMPFESIGHPETSVLANGLIQDISVGLARARWLFVSSFASTRRLAEAGYDADEVGRKLGVRYVLSGFVSQIGEKLHINATLVDTATETDVWASAFDRQMTDLFDVQRNLSDDIVTAVESEIELRERRRAILRPIESLDAWAAYHRASVTLYRFDSRALDEAEALLVRAAQLDPGFARIPAAQSFLHWQRAFLRLCPDQNQELQRAIDYAQHSLELDPHDPQGYWAMGRTGILSGDIDAAVAALSNSVDFNPNFAQGRYSLAYAQMLCGQYREGIGNVQRAYQISPFDPMCFAFMALQAMLNCFEGHDEEALKWLERSLRQPNAHVFIRVMAAWVYDLAGQKADAKRYADEVKRARPDLTRAAFFRNFPFADDQRVRVDRSLKRLGL